MGLPAVAPNASKLPYAVRRTGWRLAVWILGNGFMVAFALIMAVAMFRDPSSSFATLGLVYLGVGAMGVFGGLRLWRLRDPEVELFPDRLVRQGLFSQVVLYRSDIEGVSQTYTSRYGSYFNIAALPGRGQGVTLDGWIRKDPVVAGWLAGAVDPEVIERQADKASILADDRYGANAFERELRLKWARRIVIGFSAVCVGVALWLGFFDVQRPLALSISMGCLAIAFALVGASQGLIVWRVRSGVRPCPIVGSAPAGALAIRGCLTIHLVNAGPLLIAAGAIGIAACLLEQGSGRGSGIRTALGTAVVAGFVAFGGGKYIDAVNTGHPDHSYVVTVRDKHESQGRSTTYYLALDAWGDQPADQVDVPSAVYDAVEVGSMVCVDHFRGDLGMPWFNIGLCKTPPAGALPSPAAAS
jgi:hypothetical protein